MCIAQTKNVTKCDEKTTMMYVCVNITLSNLRKERDGQASKVKKWSKKRMKSTDFINIENSSNLLSLSYENGGLQDRLHIPFDEQLTRKTGPKINLTMNL